MDMGTQSCKKVIAAGRDKVKLKAASMKGQSGMAWFLQILVTAQFLLILYVNYAKAYHLFDIDSALAFRHGMEMWEHGLFLKDIDYFSSLEIDTVAFFGSLFFLLTGNLKLALAVSHLVGMLILTVLILDICGNLKITREQSLMALAMFFTPYSSGQLDWSNMLFICGGQYGFRVMVLLFFFDLLLMCGRKPVRKKKIVVLLVPFSLLTFWTALSAGNFVLFMILFPLICWTAIEIYLNQRLELWSMRTLVVVSGVLFALSGWILQTREIGVTRRASLTLLSQTQLHENFHTAVAGFFRLFGGMSERSDISVFSAEGISMLLRFVIPCCCLLAVWYEWRVNKKRSAFLRGILIYSFVYISVILLADTRFLPHIFEHRYHLLWCVLLVIAAGILIMGRWKQRGRWLENIPVYGFLFLILACNLWEGGKLLLLEEDRPAGVTDAVEKAKALGSNTIYTYYDNYVASITRLLEPELYCMSVSFGANGMEADTGDIYLPSADRTAVGDGNMLVCDDETFENLPAYIRSRYQKVDDGYYWSETNPWDGISGLPCESADVSVDFPYSGGYFGGGEFAENGVLVGNQTDSDDYLLRGPNTKPIPGTYDITLSYGIFQEGSQPCRLEVIVDNDVTVAGAEIPFGQETVTLKGAEVPEGERIEFRIWKPKDAIITIKQFTFERVR